MPYTVLLYLHILGGMVILGTGAGIAFFMLMAHGSGNAAFIARTASVVVIADWVFTATAVLAQPITGTLLALQTGTPLLTGWLFAALLLYALTGALWLPVVWMQHKMRDLARAAAQAGGPLPPAYHRLFRLWVACGIGGFSAVLAITWLMVAKRVW